MSINTTPDTILTWAKRHPRAVMLLATLAAIALALTITAATRSTTTPVYLRSGGWPATPQAVGDKICKPTSVADDGTPLWTCQGYAPGFSVQCVKTDELVILCSGSDSAGALTRVKVK